MKNKTLNHFISKKLLTTLIGLLAVGFLAYLDAVYSLENIQLYATLIAGIVGVHNIGQGLADSK